MLSVLVRQPVVVRAAVVVCEFILSDNYILWLLRMSLYTLPDARVVVGVAFGAPFSGTLDRPLAADYASSRAIVNQTERLHRVHDSREVLSEPRPEDPEVSWVWRCAAFTLDSWTRMAKFSECSNGSKFTVSSSSFGPPALNLATTRSKIGTCDRYDGVGLPLMRLFTLNDALRCFLLRSLSRCCWWWLDWRLALGRSETEALVGCCDFWSADGAVCSFRGSATGSIANVLSRNGFNVVARTAVRVKVAIVAVVVPMWKAWEVNTEGGCRPSLQVTRFVGSLSLYLYTRSTRDKR